MKLRRLHVAVAVADNLHVSVNAVVEQSGRVVLKRLVLHALDDVAQKARP